jgi:hypothetical protein
MAISDLFKGVFGEKKAREEVIVGEIVEGPALLESADSSPKALVFRLDSRPDLVFHQPVRPLATEHKLGDRVKVHCHPDGLGKALVDWVERA